MISRSAISSYHCLRKTESFQVREQTPDYRVVIRRGEILARDDNGNAPCPLFFFRDQRKNGMEAPVTRVDRAKCRLDGFIY
ncbi:MAG TPA: hypothetical protein DIT98_05675 [Verrucomicrobiales bacterium]|nr:hypothetical protein [Verrucomicrobiales bacterium]